MRVYTEFEWTEKHMFQSERLRTLIQIVRQAFLCRNTRRKDCESRESPEQWRYPVVLPLRNSVVGKGRLLDLLAVLHGVRKEDPFSGTGLNFRLFFHESRTSKARPGQGTDTVGHSALKLAASGTTIRIGI